MKYILFLMTVVLMANCALTSDAAYPDMHEAMEELKESWKVVKEQGTKKNWKIYPKEEAKAVAKILSDCSTIVEVKHADDTFKKYLASSQKNSLALSDVLNAETVDKKKVTAAFAALRKDCKTCHDKYKETW